MESFLYSIRYGLLIGGGVVLLLFVVATLGGWLDRIGFTELHQKLTGTQRDPK